MFSVSADSTRVQVKAVCQQDEVDLCDTVLSDAFEKGTFLSEKMNASDLDLETFVAPEFSHSLRLKIMIARWKVSR